MSGEYGIKTTLKPITNPDLQKELFRSFMYEQEKCIITKIDYSNKVYIEIIIHNFINESDGYLINITPFGINYYEIAKLCFSPE